MTDLRPRHLCDFPAEPCRCAAILATVEGEPAPIGRHEAVLRDLRAWLVTQIEAANEASRGAASGANIPGTAWFCGEGQAFTIAMTKLDELEAQ